MIYEFKCGQIRKVWPYSLNNLSLCNTFKRIKKFKMVSSLEVL